MKNIVYKSALENLASTMKGSNATYELSAKKNGRELRDWVLRVMQCSLVKTWCQYDCWNAFYMAYHLCCLTLIWYSCPHKLSCFGNASQDERNGGFSELDEAQFYRVQSI